MKSKSITSKQIVQTAIIILSSLLLVAFQNCSQTQGKFPTKSESTTGGSDIVDGPSPQVPNEPLFDSTGADLKPMSVLYSENVMISMQNQLGIQTPSARTIAAFAAGKSQLSAKGPFGNTDTVNQPMWGALTTLSGEFCVDTINLEKAKPVGSAAAPGTRSFFNQVNFTQAPNNLSMTARADSIRRLSLALWGRAETADELTQIQNGLTAMLQLPPVANTSVAVQTENAMLFVCTSMLASLDSIRN